MTLKDARNLPRLIDRVIYEFEAKGDATVDLTDIMNNAFVIEVNDSIKQNRRSLTPTGN